MQSKISGNFGENIADLKFNEPPTALRIIRSGQQEFTVEIPVTIKFYEMPDRIKNLRPCLDSIWGDVYVRDPQNKNQPVGRILQLDFKHDSNPYYDQEVRVRWTGHISNLASFEKIRNGSSPRLDISFHGEYYYLVTIENLEPVSQLRSRSSVFWINKEIEFAKEVWIEALRKIDFLENILIEIPLPSIPPSPWEEVWSAVVDAREAFEHGGKTAWKNCIASVRLALEKWQKIDKEDMGPGWKSPSTADRASRTKEQRIDNIRWHLQQLAHYSVHSHADEWTREDAILMLSSISALLAIENP